MKVEVIHDWDYPHYGRMYALKRIWQLINYIIFPSYSEEEYNRELQTFQNLEYLLDINAKYYARPNVLKESVVASLYANGVHFHPEEGDIRSPAHKVWKPGIGKNKQEEWTLKEIKDCMAMDLPGRWFKKKTEILDVHIKPERQSIHGYIGRLAEAKRKGIKWK